MVNSRMISRRKRETMKHIPYLSVTMPWCSITLRVLNNSLLCEISAHLPVKVARLETMKKVEGDVEAVCVGSMGA